jgi:hypothetical protein
MLNRIEDRCQEVINLVDELVSIMEDRMSRYKCLKKRWRSGKAPAQKFMDGAESNMDQIYELVNEGAPPEKIWAEVADVASYLAMFAERYEMASKGIKSIPLGD